ncbi:hypothetical protein ACFYZJ_37835 [Streptomyces sp. NPDC001848]|uniref:hypothetical protein n=1 Tax=Streptomyces sp. NPDC001848 TaxID=3364618 RepID=UPI0036AFE46A
MTSLPSPPDPPEPGAEPLLSQRAALIFLASAFIGVVVGVLTFFSAGNVAGALLSGLTGAGASTLGLDKLIGRR